MAEFASILKKGLLAVYLTAAHLLLIGLLFDRFVLQSEFVKNWTSPPVVESPPQPGIPLPSPEASSAPVIPEPFATPLYSPTPANLPSPGTLLIPVQGVTVDNLTDTFNDARSEGRTHDAIDIPAAAGTPVFAAADGEIVKFHDSVAGGTTIYQISADKKYFFYYAHLQSRAAGIAEKQFVRQGTTIGYVGDTGNAGPGNYHLHFAISVVVDPKRYWEGISINPYTVFKNQAQLR
ncbi:MAG TPA: M23 family metallopeptidase [Pyrinomonadaceae bacterium]|jgi:murein DD-endopeptidase MepM/ murein hydrolase activator NlpD|nr:M23 family metallopeptidase [Pyrinomonadaceae bacterium]